MSVPAWTPPFYRAPVFSLFLAVFVFEVAVSPTPPNSNAAALGVVKNVTDLPGGGEIWKIVDLKDAEALRLPGEFYYVNLGYLKRPDGSGEWVGYIGEWGDYIELDATGLKRLISEGGLSKLPVVPDSDPGSFAWYWWPIIVLFMFALAVRWIRFINWLLHELIGWEFAVWRWLYGWAMWLVECVRWSLALVRRTVRSGTSE